MSTILSKKRLAVFYSFALAIPLLFFAMLEAGLRYVDYGENLDLFITEPEDIGNEPYWLVNPSVVHRYFPKQRYAPQPPYQVFLKQKPENGYRVFVMGGSTTAGWPYPANVMFSRVLSQRLSDVFPDRYIEVVNTGIAAVNSFTLLDFVDEILVHEPDAILIYAGHNEFYGALGAASSVSVGQARWVIKTYLALLRLKTVQLVRDVVNGITAGFLSGGEEQYSTLMGRMVGDRSVPYDSEIYQVAKLNYEANLRDILGAANQADVPVMISELVSNLRDHSPFVSVENGGQLPADIVYSWAQMLEQEEMYGMARETYAWAKDLDGLRFRAPGEFNGIIHKVAAEFKVPVVPMVSYFEKESANGLIGKRLMLEHLHPNDKGYMLMSEAFFDTMQRYDFVSDQWNVGDSQSAELYRSTWPVTDLDRALGDIRIVNLTDHWPYPPKGQDDRSIEDFGPANQAEALALQVFNGELSYTEAHTKMAEHFEEQGRPDLAFREYIALVSAVPNQINYYMLAINQLLKQRAYDRALPLLFASIEIKNTGYANKWIGQIFMMKQQPMQAIPYFKEAYGFAPEDPQFLYNLGFAHTVTGHFAEAQNFLQQLEQLAPDFQKLDKLRQLLAERRPPG